MSDASTSPVRPGDLIAGKYRVERVIATGGMGVVVAARHQTLDQRVAIKFLLPEIARQTEYIARFLREARAAAKIQSEHVCRVYDVGTLDGSIVTTGDADSGILRGAPYMVMEYLEGTDLAAESAQRGPVPVADAVDWVLQALEALSEAHEAGVVHRDIKPSNLHLTRRAGGGTIIKVLDFGISKLDGGVLQDVALTSTQTMLGSPAYMSPEQVRSTKSVDARTDVWAMGVILYELLTGEMLFLGESLGEVFAKIREDPIARLRDRRPDVPEGLDRIVMRCLERKPDQRYATGGEMRAALSDWARGASLSFGMSRPSSFSFAPRDTDRQTGDGQAITLPAVSEPPPVHPARTGVANGLSDGSWGGGRREPSRTKVWIGALVATLLVGGGTAALFAARRSVTMVGAEVPPKPPLPAVSTDPSARTVSVTPAPSVVPVVATSMIVEVAPPTVPAAPVVVAVPAPSTSAVAPPAPAATTVPVAVPQHTTVPRVTKPPPQGSDGSVDALRGRY